MSSFHQPSPILTRTTTPGNFPFSTIIRIPTLFLQRNPRNVNIQIPAADRSCKTHQNPSPPNPHQRPHGANRAPALYLLFGKLRQSKSQIQSQRLFKLLRQPQQMAKDHAVFLLGRFRCPGLSDTQSIQGLFSKYCRHHDGRRNPLAFYDRSPKAIP